MVPGVWSMLQLRTYRDEDVRTDGVSVAVEGTSVDRSRGSSEVSVGPGCA